MSRRRKTQPDGFVIYRNSLNSIRLLPNESAGKVIRAAANLFLGCELAENFDTAEEIVFSQLQADVDNSITRFSEICSRNQKIAERRESNQRNVASGDHSLQLVTNRIELNQKESNQEEKNIGADKPPHTPRFIPPTVEEVAEYCNSRNNRVDARKFVDHYTANGWMRGKTKMRDWKAAIRTWENSEGTRNGSTKTTRTDADYDVMAMLKGEQ